MRSGCSDVLTDMLVIALVLGAAGVAISRLRLPPPLHLVATAALIVVAAVVLINVLVTQPLWLGVLRRH